MVIEQSSAGVTQRTGSSGDDTVWPSAKWAKWVPGMLSLLSNPLGEDSRATEHLAKVLDWEQHVKDHRCPNAFRFRVPPVSADGADSAFEIDCRPALLASTFFSSQLPEV